MSDSLNLTDEAEAAKSDWLSLIANLATDMSAIGRPRIRTYSNRSRESGTPVRKIRDCESRHVFEQHNVRF